MTDRAAHVLLALLLAFGLVACGTRDGTQRASEAGRDGEGAADHEPITIENCGEEVTIEAPPERVVLLGLDSVPLLDAVGALDRVVARSGAIPDGVYGKETVETLEGSPRIDEGEDSSGTVRVSLEAVIAEQPDLVIGYEPEGTGITRDALARAGIPLIAIPAFCPDPDQIPANPGFDDVYGQVEFYGRLFDAEDEAAETVVDLRGRVASVERSFQSSSGRAAATLYVSPGAPPSAYGRSSMSHALMDAAGLTDVFGDVDERVFEVNPEELFARDPDVLILVHGEDDPETVENEFLALPGAESLTAVREGDVLVQPFALTNLPTPLAVEGLENTAREFGVPK